ncbi:NAD-dependent epimerase [Arenibacter algicola]|uniref:NAD-dependent epimerase n=1 Tax=Arenibacter algicola TaxID=616991 RepID=UPI001C067A23|nr:NAD-dependent epimerase [Arenibacter algicola]MBU2904302.1 NAD-dependent epimerase [Arenibacter algicola]
MKILVTGAAGFIGYHLCEALLKRDIEVVGIDSINDYYDQNLKFGRLSQLGIEKIGARVPLRRCTSTKHGSKFKFVRMNLEDRQELPKLFEQEEFRVVCNLAAQAGVRYSLENPSAYIDSNIVGFVNLLECCRHYKIEHLVYASSSSVYGLNDKIPFSTTDNVDHPISLYAASKKSNELMAHTYSHLFGLPTTGLRFFTVYGPWGRPDMAIFLFTKAILDNKPINVFNHGEMERDFTYVNDIVDGVERILMEPNDKRKQRPIYNIYNIGNNKAIKLTDFIESIEHNLGKTAVKNMLPMQPGDVTRTWANVDNLIQDYNYSPDTDISVGVKSFTDWYCQHYKV